MSSERTTKIHTLADKNKRALDMTITEINYHDVIEGERIIKDTNIGVLIADKAYNSENFRQEVRNNEAKPVVPRKENSSKPNPKFKKSIYKKQHVDENFFVELRNFGLLQQNMAN
ncbi:MAG: transposase [Oligoflexales bacterium]